MNSNPEIHTIRLHGPWVAKVLASFNDESDTVDSQERRVKIPSDWGDWLGSEFLGRVEYRRNFNRPTGLEPGQNIWLVIEQIDSHGDVYLNDQLLGSLTIQGDSAGKPFRIEVAQRLQLSNVLKVEIEVNANSDRGKRTGQAGGLIGSVRIEIQQ